MLLDKTEPSVYKFEGPYVLIDKEADVKSAVVELRKTDLLGFDSESKPQFIKGGPKPKPALIQLATPDTVFLFRICKIGLIQELKEVLESNEIIKIGVGVKEDCKGLRRIDPRIKLCGFIDIAVVASMRGFKEKGLRGLTMEVLGMELWKPRSPATSNWEREELTDGQKRYSANDGMISRVLGLEIIKGRRKEEKNELSKDK